MKEGTLIPFKQGNFITITGAGDLKTIEIYTIGFAKKTAKDFFEKLKRSGAKRVVDVRLNNVSQLAGFSKKNDLIFFLKQLVNMDYIHIPDMAPTKDILDEYKKNKGDWNIYEDKFMRLMEQRRIEDQGIKTTLHQGCLLCSEHEPEHCHRRLIVEYLAKKWNKETIKVTHL